MKTQKAGITAIVVTVLGALLFAAAIIDSRPTKPHPTIYEVVAPGSGPATLTEIESIEDTSYISAITEATIGSSNIQGANYFCVETIPTPPREGESNLQRGNHFCVDFQYVEVRINALMGGTMATINEEIRTDKKHIVHHHTEKITVFVTNQKEADQYNKILHSYSERLYNPRRVALTDLGVPSD